MLLMLTLAGTLQAQFRMHPNSNFSFGTLAQPGQRDLIHVNGWRKRGLLVTVNHNVDWWQSIAAHVTRENTVSYVVRYNGRDRFYVRGTGGIYAHSIWTWSDSTLKQDVQPIKDSARLLARMRGVTFRYRPDPPCLTCPERDQEQTDERRYYGLLAQELERSLPEAVDTMADGTKVVAYQQIIPVLVEGFKAQQLEIEALKKEVARLKEDATKSGTSK